MTGAGADGQAAPRVLVADVGGTNTRVALSRGGTIPAESVRRFRNAEFGSLGEVLTAYLEAAGRPSCDAACAAVAGPVRHGVGRMTNLAWVIDGAALAAAAGAPDNFVINDLEAQGHALDDVEAAAIMGAFAAGVEAGAPRLVVGVGTGFNAAPVHAAGGDLHVVPSECGHISLPVWDDATFAIGADITARHGFASVEEALSGRGLQRLWGYFSGREAGTASTNAIIAALPGDPGKPERDAAALFCQFLGRVVGDLALIHLPWGGIYLIGGMARALAPFAIRFGFREAFRAKGRFSDFLDSFPVFLVEDDYAALIGCARYAMRNRAVRAR